MNLLRALATVGGMTLVSRVLGFVRDTIVARIFGAGIATDAFFVAFKIPNLLRRLFAEGAFSQAFVPILAEYKSRQGHEETRLLVDSVFGLLALALVVVAVLGILVAPFVVFISAPGFTATPDRFELTVHMLRVIFPYIVFISLVSFAGGILNTYGKFSVPALTPAILNVSFIIFAVWLTRFFNPPVLALAWGVVAGGVAQLAIQVPFLLKIGLLPRFRLNYRHPGARRVLKLMGPAVFGVSVAQISLLLNTLFASFLATGSVSWLYYADRLMEFPTGLLGVALGTILLPSLARHYSDKSHDEYSRLLDWGLRLTLLLALPAAVALGVAAVPLIATLFRYGAFSPTDLVMTQQALVAYSVGLLGLILVKVLAPGFYARQNIRTPVKIAVTTLIATQLMNLAFIAPFKHAGLALSISLGACLNAGLLLYHLRKQGVYHPQPGWRLFAAKIALALVAMGGILWWMSSDTTFWMQAHAGAKLVRLLLIVVAGASAYFGILFLLGMRFSDFSKRAIT